MKKKENFENNTIEFYGEELLNFRKQKGLSQEELADKINVSRQSIHLWESGKIIPDIENIIKICNVLEITTDRISRGLSVMNNEKTIDKSNKNKRNVLKYFLIIIAVFVIIYVTCSVRKSIILIKVANKSNEYRGINNYSYVEKQYLIEVDNSLQYNYSIESYYKDGIRKQIYIDLITGNKIIEYKDNVNNIKYNFDEENKTVEINEINEIKYSNQELIPVGISDMILVGEEYKKINFLLGFNPFLTIETNEDEYILNWSYKKIDDSIINVKEKINKETGLVTEQYTYNNNFNAVIQYDIKINSTTDEDIRNLNINEYKSVN